jgi:hypothetical protein
VVAAHLIVHSAIVRPQVDVFEALGVGRHAERQPDKAAIVGYRILAAAAGDLDRDRAVAQRDAVDDRHAAIVARAVRFEQADRLTSEVSCRFGDDANERESIARDEIARLANAGHCHEGREARGESNGGDECGDERAAAHEVLLV